MSFSDDYDSRFRSPNPPVMLRCSFCGKFYEVSLSPCRPFCSERCQQIDLGNWLNEAYGLPYESDQSEGHRESDDETDH